MQIVSVFNRDEKNFSFVEAVSGILCLFNLSYSVGLQIFPVFLIIGIADCVCGILIWCEFSLFLFDSHCHDRSALPVFICWWEIHSCKSMLWAREKSLDHLNITYQPRSWKWRTNCFLFFCFVYIVVKNISSLPNQMLKLAWFSHVCLKNSFVKGHVSKYFFQEFLENIGTLGWY